MRLRLLGGDAVAAAYDLAFLAEVVASGGVSRLAELTVADCLESTNSEALERAGASEAEEFVAVIADRQTAGRGRRGRSWQSPPGTNIYLSVAWRTRLPFTQSLGALPLAIGVAIADALTGLGVHAALKWPNDLYVDGGKLGGILLESRVLADRIAVVVGIGLNHHPDAALCAAIDQPIRFLAERSPGLRREAVAAEIIAAVTGAIAAYREQGIAPFLSLWSDRDLLRNRIVCVDAAEGAFHGVAIGIDNDGGLLIQTDSGIRCCQSGEVSVRAT
ncbi:MAG: biotin--[acetyl-CoA-carboxylase] ligase [Gammaproteobacteria bacterium]|nr:biotin--[acetyl-CoA-carboxylase] ligase [Gammaproteobacteria bacterium]